MTADSDKTQHDREGVLLVHGLWFGSWALRQLSQRLQFYGFRVNSFSYDTRSASLYTHANALGDCVKQMKVQRLHLVGHSLGGLVILRMLAAENECSPGRIVLLGSPLGGSRVAQRLVKMPGALNFLGGVQSALEQGFNVIPQSREVGMIAGSLSLGLGMLTGGTGGPGDGTVPLEETRAPGLKERLVLPVSHTGLLYSKKVASHTGKFLMDGQF